MAAYELPGGVWISSNRLLIRGSMTELYLNDLLIKCYNLPALASHQLGFVVETGSAEFLDLKAWEMNLDEPQSKFL